MGRIRTSQKDYDVLTDEPRYLTLDSDRNQFKVEYSDSFTFSLNSTNSYSYTETVTHNFGYTPQVLAFAYTAIGVEGETYFVKLEKFRPMPFLVSWLSESDEPVASFVASIDKNTSTVKFKFFQQTDFVSPEPSNYTLTDMKCTYLIYIDKE